MKIRIDRSVPSCLDKLRYEQLSSLRTLGIHGLSTFSIVQNQQSNLITEVDLENVSFCHDDTVSLHSFNQRDNRTLLDMRVLEVLLQNRELIPQIWVEKFGRSFVRQSILFPGTLVQEAYDTYSVPSLYWHHGWCWGLQSLTHRDRCVLAVI